MVFLPFVLTSEAYVFIKELFHALQKARSNIKPVKSMEKTKPKNELSCYLAFSGGKGINFHSE